jgi:uncharacterized protein (TIGR02145 family)/uncharacterized repeat protein (TIGR02543 family)
MSTPTPTRDGYTFHGWWSAETEGYAVTAGTGYANFESDATIYARWTLNHYRVTFDAHGGEVTPAYDSTGDGWKLASLPTPTRDEYHEFAGWYTELIDGTGEKVDVSRVYNANTTIYAHWVYTGVHYTITFDAGGGTVDPATEETDAGGKLQDLPLPERDGYAFTGWYTEKTGGAEVTTNTVFNKEDTIYARWILITESMYAVTFEPHGGSVSPKRGVTGEDGKLLRPLPTPKREGFAFQGWFSEDDSVTAGTIFKSNSTVHALWAIVHYTVTFDATGGTVSPPTGTTGIHWELDTLPTPVRDGYAFIGWYTEKTGGAHVTPRTPLIAVSAVYAHWTDKPPSLIDSRDGKAYRETAIGEQIWMAENLNYETGGSVCYNNSEDSCSKYGRLYTWSEAMTACPAGWHLPIDDEWTTLTDFVVGLSPVGTAAKLKSKTGWPCDPGLGVVCGTDEYGFSAIPAGVAASLEGVSGYNFGLGGDAAVWWSATERGDKPEEIYTRDILGGDMSGNVLRHSYEKSRLFSVRCVQD